MTDEALISIFTGAALAAIGAIVLGAGLVHGMFRPPKPLQRSSALALTGLIFITTGIWLLRAMS